MGLLEDYRNSRNKAQVAFTEFMLHTRQNKDGLFCFFEGGKGTDNPYYVPRIKQYTSSYYPIRCSGRDRVLEVHELIRNRSEYNKYKKSFFIDKDFNPGAGIMTPPIYETPCYSIENFYASIEVFKEILINALNVAEFSPDFNICLEIFSQRQTEFHQSTLLFNAWYACLIENRNKTGEMTNVNLDNKFPKEFIDFSLDNISSKYNIQNIRETYPTAPQIEDDKLDNKISEFETAIMHKIFRGKFEFGFVLSLINLMIIDSRTVKKYIKNPIKFTFGENVSIDQGIAIFSPYAETPDELNIYIKSVL